MKNKYSLSLIATILLILLNFNLPGQNRQAKTPVLESAPFPIMTWYGLTADQLDIAHFKELADAGFNINSSDLRTPELNKKALELAQQVGIKLIISDSRIQPGKPVDVEAAEKLKQVVKDYSGYPALLGYFVVDETSAGNFENLASIKKQIFLLDTLHLVYVNLLPDYANEQQLGTKTYQEHVDKYIKVFHPQILSYDYYPFINTGFRDTYYPNMEVIRKSALKAGIPFWAFTMSCQIYPPYPQPKESWIRLQLFSDLAYGSKGLQYFTYALPHSEAEDFKTAILDTNGKATYLYDIARYVNSEINSIGSVIKQLNSIDVFHTDPLPKGTRPLPDNFYIKSISGGPMVVGYLKDKSGHPYIMLVNRNYDKEVNFTIGVSEKVKGFEEVSKFGEGPVVFKTKKGEIKLHFKDGDGRLFRVKF